jgi:hypothetical protein
MCRVNRSTSDLPLGRESHAYPELTRTSGCPKPIRSPDNCGAPQSAGGSEAFVRLASGAGDGRGGVEAVRVASSGSPNPDPRTGPHRAPRTTPPPVPKGPVRPCQHPVSSTTVRTRKLRMRNASNPARGNKRIAVATLSMLGARTACAMTAAIHRAVERAPSPQGPTKRGAGTSGSQSPSRSSHVGVRLRGSGARG